MNNYRKFQERTKVRGSLRVPPASRHPLPIMCLRRFNWLALRAHSARTAAQQAACVPYAPTKPSACRGQRGDALASFVWNVHRQSKLFKCALQEYRRIGCREIYISDVATLRTEMAFRLGFNRKTASVPTSHKARQK